MNQRIHAGEQSLELPKLANRVGFERRPERPVYPRLRTLDRLRPCP